MFATYQPNPPWFFVALPESFEGPAVHFPLEITLEDDKFAHHLKHGMRLHPGDALIVADKADKGCYKAVLQGTHRQSVTLELQQAWEATVGQAPPIIAAISLIKGPRWDWMLQKLTELGVTEIMPLQASRSVVVVKEAEKKHARWGEILQSAAEQSEQRKIPILHPVMSVEGLFKQLQERGSLSRLFAWELNAERHSSFKTDLSQPVCFAIGPEGGWAAEEVEAFLQNSFEPIGLGDSILRSETAAIHMASVIRYVRGNLSV